MVRPLRRPDPLVFVIVALLAAAGLVVYLQHRALMALDRQTGLVLQKISEQTAASAADEIRRTFEAPVFDALNAVNHPALRSDRLDLVTPHYARGLERYPHIERFLLWNAKTDAVAPGEVVFYQREPRPQTSAATGDGALGGFQRDPSLGRAIRALADRHAARQQIYVAAEHREGERRYDVFLRLFWTDARRDRYFAVLGFIVNLGSVRTRVFPELYRARLEPLFNPSDGSPQLEMRILDETGVAVFSPPDGIPPLNGRAPFALRFYPADLRPRLASQTPDRVWTVVVSPVSGNASATLASTWTHGYWLSGLSVLLMLVALAFARQGQKRASQLARMQADFVSQVSHQLKTPLALLSVTAETLALDRARSPEKLTRYLDIMRAETARLSVLIEHILHFSRVDGGGRRLELESVSLLPLVRETADAFARRLATEGVDIRVEGQAEDATLLVAADPAALEQVLVNLLDNAVKYSDQCKVVTVRLTRTTTEAIVEVADRGIGIPPSEIPRIFDRFYRGAGSRLNRKGFGLGLAIAQELVRAHRGRIDVESTPGQGSRFRVRLPILHGSRQPGEAREAAAHRRDARPQMMASAPAASEPITRSLS